MNADRKDGFLNFFTAMWHRILDILLPPLCLTCRAPIGQAGALCVPCWEKLDFISPPWCKTCGAPFEWAEDSEVECGECLSTPPNFDKARTVLRYNDASKPLVVAFKYADQTHAAPIFARWMARVDPDLLAQTDLIVPVPLHPRRLFARRYNQAALLAQAIGKSQDLPVMPMALIRKRHTPSQGRKGRKARVRNVSAAFAIHPRARDRIAGKDILLIDDVLTTGATIRECSRVLKRAGAKRVFVLTLARSLLTGT